MVGTEDFSHPGLKFLANSRTHIGASNDYGDAPFSQYRSEVRFEPC